MHGQQGAAEELHLPARGLPCKRLSRVCCAPPPRRPAHRAVAPGADVPGCAGHYVSYVNSHGHWLFFDDEDVVLQDERAVQTSYGSAQVRTCGAGTLCAPELQLSPTTGCSQGRHAPGWTSLLRPCS